MDRRARCRICKELVTYKNPNDLGSHLIKKHPDYNPVYFTSDETQSRKTKSYVSKEQSKKSEKSVREHQNHPKSKLNLSKKSKSVENIPSSTHPKSTIDVKEKLQSFLHLSGVNWFGNGLGSSTARSNSKQRKFYVPPSLHANCDPSIYPKRSSRTSKFLHFDREEGRHRDEGRHKDEGRHQSERRYREDVRHRDERRYRDEGRYRDEARYREQGRNREEERRRKEEQIVRRDRSQDSRRSAVSEASRSSAGSSHVSRSSQIVACCNETCPKKKRSCNKGPPAPCHFRNEDEDSLHIIKGCKNKGEIKVYNKNDCQKGPGESFFGVSPECLKKSHHHCEEHKRKSPCVRKPSPCERKPSCERQKYEEPEEEEPPQPCGSPSYEIREPCMKPEPCSSNVRQRDYRKQCRRREEKPCRIRKPCRIKKPCDSPTRIVIQECERPQPGTCNPRDPCTEESYVKLYETMVTSWMPANKKIECPYCGKCMIPMLRKQRKKITKHSLAASLLLTCWPIIFLLPMSFTYQYKAFCAVCNKSIGTYDKKTHSIKMCMSS